MKKIVYVIFIIFISCSPYKKIPNISRPTYKKINKSMKSSEPWQPKKTKDTPCPKKVTQYKFVFYKGLSYICIINDKNENNNSDN